jgi:hypothetical protein
VLTACVNPASVNDRDGAVGLLFPRQRDPAAAEACLGR